MTIRSTTYPIALSKLHKTVRYSTDITVGKNGAEVRNANWQDPLLRFNASSGIRSRADVATLEAFFHLTRGREVGFLLQDLTDYAIPQSGSTPQAIGTATAGQTAFQLSKTYTDALSNTYSRTITRPSATTSDLAVYDNGVLQTHTTHYTYSTTTGIITFTSGRTVGHVITVTLAKFYVPVRFDIDELPIDLICYWIDGSAPYSLADLPDVPMTEIRE